MTCGAIAGAYMLIILSGTAPVCVPMESIGTCRLATRDFTENFISLSSEKAQTNARSQLDKGYTVYPMGKKEKKNTRLSLTCVRGKTLSRKKKD